jgi:hypothetical protein
MPYPARHQSSLSERPDADCEVKTIFDQVNIAIGEHELGAHASSRKLAVSSHLAQNCIACIVTMVVIELLELIDIDRKDSDI